MRKFIFIIDFAQRRPVVLVKYPEEYLFFSFIFSTPKNPDPIIQVNENFGSDLTDDDRVNLEKIQARLHEDEELKKVHFGDNTESNKRFVFNKTFDDILQGLVDDSLDFYKKLTEPKRNRYVKDRFYEEYPKSV